MEPLEGSVALVTGAGRGLGREFALHLARNGARVGLCARSVDQLTETASLIEAAGGQSLAVTCDVADPAAVRVATARVESDLGPIDLLVNNAAVATPIGPVAQVDPDQWWRTFEVNVRGPFLLTRAVLPGMIERRRGRIVNLASMVATTAVAYLSAYSVTKAALLRFTESVAAEIRGSGVTIFSMEPGTVRTAMAQDVLDSPEGRRWVPWFRALFDKGLDVDPQQAADLLISIASGRVDAMTGRFMILTDSVDRIRASADTILRQDLYTLRLRRLPDDRSA